MTISTKLTSTIKGLSRFSVGGLVTFACLVASPAQSATVGPFSQIFPSAFNGTDFVTQLQFFDFDTNLGTLTGVRFDVTVDLNTAIEVVNSSDSPSSGSVRTEVLVTLQDANSLLPGAPQIDALVPAAPWAYSINAGDTLLSPSFSRTILHSETTSNPTILADFSNGGLGSLYASTFTSTLLSNTGGNTSASQDTEARISATVTYFYQPVPEPSALLLCAGGLASLAALAYRRRAA